MTKRVGCVLMILNMGYDLTGWAELGILSEVGYEKIPNREFPTRGVFFVSRLLRSNLFYQTP